MDLLTYNKIKAAQQCKQTEYENTFNGNLSSMNLKQLYNMKKIIQKVLPDREDDVDLKGYYISCIEIEIINR